MESRSGDIRKLVEEGIPFLKKVGVKVEAIERTRVRLHFPHDRTSDNNDNYVGNTHAGAIFTVGETCAGVAAGAAFDLGRLRMLARRAEVAYRRPVTGDLRGRAEISAAAAARVEQALARQGRATLPVVARVQNSAGEMVAEITVCHDFRTVA